VGRDLRVAVIGAGNMGRHHVRLYHAMAGVELVAIVDLAPSDQVLAMAGGARVYTDYASMFAKEPVDAVSIVLPTALHLEVAVAALEAGAHVLVEKPIAASVAEAEAMMAAAKRVDRVFTVGHIERYNPVVQRLRSLIQEGAVGTVSSVATRRLGGFPSVQPPTNVIIDLAIHDLDVVAHLTGERPHLLAAHGSRTFHPDQVDSAELLVRYGQASGLLQANWVTPVKIRSIAVTGSKGYLEANYVTQEVLHFQASVTPETAAWTDFVARFGNPVRVSHAEAPREPLALELEAYISACRGLDADVVDPLDATVALQTALEAVALIEGRADPD
jgi:UDP-N-acetylglucosamine 3-dehydrogenase